MKSHSSPALVFFVLLLGLMATVGIAELALQLHRNWLFIPALGMAMILALWLWILLPPKASTREQHRMRLIRELQNLQDTLDMAIQTGNAGNERLIQGWIKEVKEDPDFSFSSWD